MCQVAIICDDRRLCIGLGSRVTENIRAPLQRAEDIAAPPHGFYKEYVLGVNQTLGPQESWASSRCGVKFREDRRCQNQLYCGCLSLAGEETLDQHKNYSNPITSELPESFIVD
ncbi:hypothetical protein TNCV_4686411 [Trichonephila clavipes]|nr:hypothetical protein TNCV_4686411 [Trichonephila clavipes]